MDYQCSRLFAFFIITLATSCDPAENETGPRNLTGIVVSSDAPVEGATVILKSDFDEYRSSTDAQGRFDIEGVHPGEYVFTVRGQREDKHFMQLQQDLSINSTTKEQIIELPKGTTLQEALEVTGTSVKLSWNKSEISDFLEYKLYRHSTSGLDESTGTLVHVATNANDTVFTEQGLRDNQTYFYRVFVRNSFGLYGGSNIREVKTAREDQVQNGDLENGMANWELFSPSPCVSIVQDPTAPVSPTVFKFQISDNSTANVSSEVFQTINHTKFAAGETYKLSFSARTESLPGTSVFYVYVMANENFNHIVSIKLDNTASTGWTTYSKDFVAPSATAPFSLFLYLEPLIPYNNELIEVYVDDILIVRQ